jgi:hypothetical protein
MLRQKSDPSILRDMLFEKACPEVLRDRIFSTDRTGATIIRWTKKGVIKNTMKTPSCDDPNSSRFTSQTR